MKLIEYIEKLNKGMSLFVFGFNKLRILNKKTFFKMEDFKSIKFKLENYEILQTLGTGFLHFYRDS